MLFLRDSKRNKKDLIDKVLDAKEKMREKLNKKSDSDIVDNLPNADDIRKLLRNGPSRNDSSAGTSKKNDDSGIRRKGSIF